MENKEHIFTLYVEDSAYKSGWILRSTPVKIVQWILTYLTGNLRLSEAVNRFSGDSYKQMFLSKPSADATLYINFLTGRVYIYVTDKDTGFDQVSRYLVSMPPAGNDLIAVLYGNAVLIDGELKYSFQELS